MERAKTERYIVAILFVLVLIVFSFAERDSRKLEKLYTGVPGPVERPPLATTADTLPATRH